MACVLQSKVACILQYKVSSVLQCKLPVSYIEKWPLSYRGQGSYVLNCPQMSLSLFGFVGTRDVKVETFGDKW